MAHVRAQITAALAATLTGLTTTGARVHVARPADLAFEATALPALLIYADSEQVASAEILAWPRRLMRDIDIRVEGIAQDDGTLETTLSTMLAEIEAALHASASAASCGGLLVQPLLLSGVEVMRDGDAERTVGRLATSWTASYATYSNAPETAIG